MNSLTIQFFYFDIFLDDVDTNKTQLQNITISELFTIWKKGNLMNKKLKWCNKKYYALEWMSIPWVTVNFLKKLSCPEFEELSWKTFTHTPPHVKNHFGRGRCHWIASLRPIRRLIFNPKLYPNYNEIFKKDDKDETPVIIAQRYKNRPMVYIFLYKLIQQISYQHKLPYYIEILIRQYMTYNALY